MPESGVSSYRWVVMSTWMIAHVWAFILVESLGFLLPSMREELGLSPVQEGWLGASARISTVFLAIPSSWLFSRFRPKTLTTVTLIAGSIFTLLQGWAPVYAILFIGRFLTGISGVVREPARTLLTKQWMQAKEVVLVNAIMGFLFGVAGVAFILTPVLLKLFDDSWRNTLYLFGGISLVLTVAWLVLGKERTTPEYAAELRSQERIPIGRILKYKELWLVGMGMFGIGVNFSAAGTFWPSFMLDTYDVSLTASASLVSIMAATAAVAGLGVGFMVSRTGKRKLVLWLTGIIMSLASVGMLWTGSYSELVLLSLGRGLAWGFFPVMMTMPFELPEIKTREIAVAAAFLQTATILGAVVGPVLAGSLQQATGDLRMALLVTSVWPAALTVGALLLPRKWNELTVEQRTLDN